MVADEEPLVDGNRQDEFTELGESTSERPVSREDQVVSVARVLRTDFLGESGQSAIELPGHQIRNPRRGRGPLRQMRLPQCMGQDLERLLSAQEAGLFQERLRDGRRHEPRDQLGHRLRIPEVPQHGHDSAPTDRGEEMPQVHPQHDLLADMRLQATRHRPPRHESMRSRMRRDRRE